MVFLYISLYLIGGVITYFASKFYGWDIDLDGVDKPPFELFILFWFVGLPLMILCILIAKFLELGTRVSEAGKQHRIKIKEQAVAQLSEKEQQDLIFKQLETEIKQEEIPPHSYHKG